MHSLTIQFERRPIKFSTCYHIKCVRPFHRMGNRQWTITIHSIPSEFKCNIKWRITKTASQKGFYTKMVNSFKPRETFGELSYTYFVFSVPVVFIHYYLPPSPNQPSFVCFKFLCIFHSKIQKSGFRFLTFRLNRQLSYQLSNNVRSVFSHRSTHQTKPK